MHRRIVLVWDLDETLILFNSLQNGTYPVSASGSALSATKDLGAALADTIVDFCDENLHFAQVRGLLVLLIDSTSSRSHEKHMHMDGEIWLEQRNPLLPSVCKR